MEITKNLSKMWNAHKADIIALSVITFIFLFFSSINIQRPSGVIYDIGREAIIPQLILEGKILYKEIFAMYNPLSYQINAVLYYFLGTSLNTIYSICLVNTYLIFLGGYILSRQIMTVFSSGVVCLIMLSSCILCVYLFPYSFGIVYALCAFIYFALFSVLYLKSTEGKTKRIYSYIASFLMGLSLAFRFEYVLAYIPFFILLVYKKSSFKQIIVNLTLLFMPSIISWGVLFLQGFNIQDFQNYLNFGINLFASEEQKSFQKGGASPFALFEHLSFTLCIAVLFFTTFFVNDKTLKLIKSLTSYKKVLAIFFYLLFYAAITMLIVKLFLYRFFAITCLICIYIAIVTFKKNDTKNNCIFLLSLFGILSSVRVGCLYYHFYSIFYILVPIIACYAYFIDSKMNFLRSENKKNIVIFLIIISLINISYFSFKMLFLVKITTPCGNIYAEENVAKVYNSAINWINKNTKPDESILVLPEAPMLNFMTNRQTLSKYYQLLPNHIKAIGGEEKIIKDFVVNPPDYIFIQSIDYHGYGKNYFGIDFGKDIFIYIINNYNLVTQIKSENSDTEFFITIFKLKTKH